MLLHGRWLKLALRWLAFTSLDLLGLPPVGLRFEVHPHCCRRYHVLSELLSEMPRPLRILEIGAAGLMYSSYIGRRGGTALRRL